MVGPASGEVHDFARSRGFIDVVVEPPLIEGEVFEWEDRLVLVGVAGIPSGPVSIQRMRGEGVLTRTSLHPTERYEPAP